MSSVSYVYVLVYPEIKALKIGKANCTLSRIKSLNIGKVDYGRSYHIEVGEDKVFLLEKALHSMFKNNNLSLSGFDGATEMFDIGCYEAVRDHLKLIMSFYNDCLDMRPITLPKRKMRKGEIRSNGGLRVDVDLYEALATNSGVFTHKELSDIVDVSVSTVKRSLLRLIGLGCVEITNRVNGHALRYTAIKPPVEGLPVILSRRDMVMVKKSIYISQ